LLDFRIEKLVGLFSNVVDKSDDLFMIVGVARKGMDKAVIKLFRGLKVFKIVAIPKCTITELYERAEAIRKHYKLPLSNVLADEDGVGWRRFR